MISVLTETRLSRAEAALQSVESGGTPDARPSTRFARGWNPVYPAKFQLKRKARLT